MRRIVEHLDMDIPVAIHRKGAARAIIALAIGLKDNHAFCHIHIEHGGKDLDMFIDDALTRRGVPQTNDKEIGAKAVWRDSKLHQKFSIRGPCVRLEEGGRWAG